MPSHVFKRGPTTPAMNITPLIDVVFLLIVFFMLVSTIQMQEAAEMIVPDVDDSQVRELPRDDRVVVNVVPQPFSRSERAEHPLAFPGRARFIQIGAHDRYEVSDLAGVTAALERALQRNADVEVVLRADAALHYSEVQPVMEAVRASGVRRVNLVAYEPG